METGKFWSWEAADCCPSTKQADECVRCNCYSTAAHWSSRKGDTGCCKEYQNEVFYISASEISKKKKLLRLITHWKLVNGSCNGFSVKAWRLLQFWGLKKRQGAWHEAHLCTTWSLITQRSNRVDALIVFRNGKSHIQLYLMITSSILFWTRSDNGHWPFVNWRKVWFRI